jgi:hypothetical protein
LEQVANLPSQERLQVRKPEQVELQVLLAMKQKAVQVEKVTTSTLAVLAVPVAVAARMCQMAVQVVQTVMLALKAQVKAAKDRAELLENLKKKQVNFTQVAVAHMEPQVAKAVAVLAVKQPKQELKTQAVAVAVAALQVKAAVASSSLGM